MGEGVVRGLVGGGHIGWVLGGLSVCWGVVGFLGCCFFGVCVGDGPIL